MNYYNYSDMQRVKRNSEIPIGIESDDCAGNWWTSCQYSETNSVNLNNGGFNNNNKTNSNSVLPVYEI